ncbi:hypothetical protein [Marinobacter sp. JSM 1782161]|uniref:hypothetical protein n=1 Tax=Marinobacter sp. JSM 1782161 TaxID=2685906 RepID=UPI001404178F|nr:hypothetical protein [Marinobacter sp. JSM 1782161]
MSTPILFIKHQCSKSEQEMLRVLRAIHDRADPFPGIAPQLGHQGVSETDIIDLIEVFQALFRQFGRFDMLGPKSPCVSRDELDLLATLNYFARYRLPMKGVEYPEDSGPSYDLLQAGAALLERVGVAFRPRPMPETFAGFRL